MKAYKCDDCHDTGWVGDNGPGRNGNSEYHECHCSFVPQRPYPFEKVKAFLDEIYYLSINYQVHKLEKKIWDETQSIIKEINLADLPH